MDAKRSAELSWIGLVVGVLAIAATLIPAVGDIVSLPLGATALIVGLICTRRRDAGSEFPVVPGVIGAILGAISLFASGIGWLMHTLG